MWPTLLTSILPGLIDKIMAAMILAFALIAVVLGVKKSG